MSSVYQFRPWVSKVVSWEICITAGWENVDGTGCVVQYEHPLCSDRYSFVKSPADLNGALLLKHSEAISSAIAHLQERVPGGHEPHWVFCRLRSLFSKKTCSAHARWLTRVCKVRAELVHIEGQLCTVIQWIKKSSSWSIHQICPEATENVIFVLVAVCCQKWINLSKAQHLLRTVGKQKS